MAELYSRIEELERLKDQMEAVGVSIAKAVSDGTIILNHKTDSFPKGTFTHSLSSEVGNLESAEGVHSAQAATATLHKDWLGIKSADVSVQTQTGLSDLFSSGRSGRAQREKLENEKVVKAQEAFKKYYTQGEPRKSDRQADLTQVCQI